jgi:hypothetical protein
MFLQYKCNLPDTGTLSTSTRLAFGLGAGVRGCNASEGNGMGKTILDKRYLQVHIFIN